MFVCLANANLVAQGSRCCSSFYKATIRYTHLQGVVFCGMQQYARGQRYLWVWLQLILWWFTGLIRPMNTAGESLADSVADQHMGSAGAFSRLSDSF